MTEEKLKSVLERIRILNPEMTMEKLIETLLENSMFTYAINLIADN